MPDKTFEFDPARHAQQFTHNGCGCTHGGQAQAIPHNGVSRGGECPQTNEGNLQGTSDETTVAVLYPGEMGTSLARRLRERGARVVTTLENRSEGTARRCREAGVTVLGSLREVVRVADVVISVVPPASSGAVVDSYCELAHLSPPQALYVDANAIGPELARSLADRLARCGRHFVDGSIHGLAANLAGGATLFLSGRRADEVARLAAGAMRVRVLGTEPGAASLMKMLLSGVSKGLCALFLELATLARRRDVLPEMMESCSHFYPEIVAMMERLLPTVPRHVVRRAGEVRELEKTAITSDLDPCVIGAIRQFYERLACVPLSAAPGIGDWTAASLIEHLAANESPGAALAADLLESKEPDEGTVWHGGLDRPKYTPAL